MDNDGEYNFKNCERHSQTVIAGGNFMLDEKGNVSKVLIPINRISRDILDPQEWPKPNWIHWRHKNKIELWEAAFLCFNIDPHQRSYLDIDHYDLHTLEIGVCLSLLKSELFRREFFSTPYTHAQGEVSTFDSVKLPELAVWAINRGYDIPKELAVLAKKPETETITQNEDQDTNLYLDRKQKPATQNRTFLQDCIEEGISPNIEAIWQHIIENAGKPNFLFKIANKVTAITINDNQVQKKNLARRLKYLLKKSKNKH